MKKLCTDIKSDAINMAVINSEIVVGFNRTDYVFPLVD